MPDQHLTDLTESTTPSSTDLVYVVADPAGTPVNRKVQIGNLADTIATDPALTGTYATVNEISDYLDALPLTPSGDVTGVADTAVIQALLNANTRAVRLGPGTFYHAGLSVLPGRRIVGDGPHTTLTHVAAGVGIDIAPAAGTGADAQVEDLTLAATLVGATHAVRVTNMYDVTLRNVRAPAPVNSWSTAIVEVISSAPNNSAVFTLDTCHLQGAQGDGLKVTGGGAVIAVHNSRIQGCVGYGISGLGNGGVELQLTESDIEGNLGGQMIAEWLVAAVITGNHFENSGLQATPLIVLSAATGAFTGVVITANVFGGAAASYGIDMNGAAANQGVLIEGNLFSDCSVAGIRLKNVWSVSLGVNVLGGGTPQLYVQGLAPSNRRLWLMSDNGLVYAASAGQTQPKVSIGTTGIWNERLTLGNADYVAAELADKSNTWRLIGRNAANVLEIGDAADGPAGAPVVMGTGGLQLPSGTSLYAPANGVSIGRSGGDKAGLYGTRIVQPARAGQLTDNSGGASGGDTIAAVAAAVDPTAAELVTTANAIATLAARLNAVEAALSAAGGGVGVTA